MVDETVNEEPPAQGLEDGWDHLTSSNIAAIRYNGDEFVLSVRFRSGRVYEYQDVPSVVYEGLRDAESPGRYLNQNVKNAGYSFRAVP